MRPLGLTAPWTTLATAVLLALSLRTPATDAFGEGGASDAELDEVASEQAEAQAEAEAEAEADPYTHFKLYTRMAKVRPVVCGRVIDRVIGHEFECMEPWDIGTKRRNATTNGVGGASAAGDRRGNTASDAFAEGAVHTGYFFGPPTNGAGAGAGARAGAGAGAGERRAGEALPVFVTGLENSGTSAVTASLRMLGVVMGADNVLMSTHEDDDFTTISRCPIEQNPGGRGEA